MPTAQTETKASRLRRLMEEPGILICPGIYDGFSARLVEMMGFKTAAISGAGVSESKLGWADVGLMGYEENVSTARALAAVTEIPLHADGGEGGRAAARVPGPRPAVGQPETLVRDEPGDLAVDERVVRCRRLQPQPPRLDLTEGQPDATTG